MDDTKIELPACDQYDKDHEESWAYRMCAPCSLWTLIMRKNPDLKLTPLQVRDELLAHEGYLENVGFKHRVIAEMGARYGIPLTYAKRFYYTPEEKEIGMKRIDANIAAGYPVIISMYSHFTPARPGHMVIVQGYQRFNDQTLGYYIQSSDATFRGHNYFVAKEEFVANWRGGMISTLD